MLDHIGVQVGDLARSRRFYEAVLAPLGGRVAMDFGTAIGFATDGGPDFWISSTQLRPDREVHIAFTASDRAAVDAFHAAALADDAEELHAPAEHPEYHAGYYGAFVRDPDGNNVEAVYHGKR